MSAASFLLRNLFVFFFIINRIQIVLCRCGPIHAFEHMRKITFKNDLVFKTCASCGAELQRTFFGHKLSLELRKKLMPKLIAAPKKLVG